MALNAKFAIVLIMGEVWGLAQLVFICLAIVLVVTLVMSSCMWGLWCAADSRYRHYQNKQQQAQEAIQAHSIEIEV